MQGIHHTHKKQAANIGVTLEYSNNMVKAFWPEHALVVYGESVAGAIEQMKAAQLAYRAEDIKVVPDTERPLLVHAYRNGDALSGGPRTPSDVVNVLSQDVVVWERASEHDPEIERINGVPTDGGIAHKEGFTAADCPYTSETESDGEYAEFERWNNEFDDHADEAEEDKGGSVVATKYRAIYAEAGHPTHCGDFLAMLLNNLCLTKEGTDLARFEAICAANGVDTSKYRREGNGWQGRLRMTGRNLLAKKVFQNGGVLLTPIEGAEEQYQMPADWMGSRKFTKGA